jgi:hypothetical protein
MLWNTISLPAALLTHHLVIKPPALSDTPAPSGCPADSSWRFQRQGSSPELLLEQNRKLWFLTQDLLYRLQTLASENAESLAGKRDALDHLVEFYEVQERLMPEFDELSSLHAASNRLGLEYRSPSAPLIARDNSATAAVLDARADEVESIGRELDHLSDPVAVSLSTTKKSEHRRASRG